MNLSLVDYYVDGDNYISYNMWVKGKYNNSKVLPLTNLEAKLLFDNLDHYLLDYESYTDHYMDCEDNYYCDCPEVTTQTVTICSATGPCTSRDHRFYEDIAFDVRDIKSTLRNLKLPSVKEMIN